MATTRVHLGDAHNFGRRVQRRGAKIHKPRTLLWEWLLLSAKSPLRRLLAKASAHDALGADAFSFLPDLSFSAHDTPEGGDVDAVKLAPLRRGKLSFDQKRNLAQIVGRSIALWSWLGVSDLHWENLVLGVNAKGHIIFSPLDVEMILADLSLPTQTKLLPEADPEYIDICRHACGVRRALPYLGKPVEPLLLLTIAASYRQTLHFLDRNAREIAAVIGSQPALRQAPIRILLRGTDEYVHADQRSLWPPLLDAESEQLARGDIPYFFRLYGRPGIHYFGDASLSVVKSLPSRGDVPQLDPMLQLSRSLRSPSRAKLREEGLFTVIGAFDHRGIAGKHAVDGLEVSFQARTLVVRLPSGEELESRRDLRAFVETAYSLCSCGEVESVFVPEVTHCDAPNARG